MKLRAVLFDLGNTLLQYGLHGHWRAFLRQRLEEIYPTLCDPAVCEAVSPEAFAERASEVISGEQAHQLIHTGGSWPFRKRLEAALVSLRLPHDRAAIDRASVEFYAPIRESTSLYPDTFAVLDQLQADGRKLAIISDTPWDVPGSFCFGDMQKWGLDRYFPVTVFSGDRPYRKPSIRVLTAAAQELGVELATCVAVGDTLAAEIAAANAADVPSIWIDRQGTRQPWEGAQPSLTVHSLSELPAALVQLEERLTRELSFDAPPSPHPTR
jgi:FMN phosphatase YigB (HAD superfamily)